MVGIIYFTMISGWSLLSHGVCSGGPYTDESFHVCVRIAQGPLFHVSENHT